MRKAARKYKTKFTDPRVAAANEAGEALALIKKDHWQNVIFKSIFPSWKNKKLKPNIFLIPKSVFRRDRFSTHLLEISEADKMLARLHFGKLKPGKERPTIPSGLFGSPVMQVFTINQEKIHALRKCISALKKEMGYPEIRMFDERWRPLEQVRYLRPEKH